MKNSILSFTILSIVLIFNNCSEQRDVRSAYSYKKILIDSDKSSNKIYTSNIFSDIEYIPLETTNECLIGEISRIIYYKKRFYILDTQTKSIFCFSNAGKFIYKIKSVGPGPGEYLNPNSISIDDINDNLLVYCNKTHQVLRYDLDGNFIKTIRINFYATHFTFLSENRFVFFCDFTHSNKKLQRNHMMPNLIITTAKGKILSSNLPYNDRINYSLIPIASSLFNSLSDDISFATPFNDTIYHVSAETNELKRAYLFDFVKSKKDDDFFNKLYDQNMTTNDLDDYIKRRNIANIFLFVESNSNIFIIYVIKREIHFCFYDKINHVFYDSSTKNEENPYSALEDDINGGPFPLPQFSDPHNMYGYFNPNEIINYQNKISNHSSNKNPLKSIVKLLTEYDNPVVFILKFKQSLSDN